MWQHPMYKNVTLHVRFSTLSPMTSKMKKKAHSQPATVKVNTTNHLFLKIGHNLSAQELFPNTHNMFTNISLM